MSAAKKIIKNIVESGFESVKDGAKQAIDTVSPSSLVEHALGTAPRKTNELTDYLKSLSPDLTAGELEKKRMEFEKSNENELGQARQAIKAAMPDHMKLSGKPEEISPHEQTVADMERKKAGELEMQKRQQSQVITPKGKAQQGSLLTRKKRPSASTIESSKNIKIG